MSEFRKISLTKKERNKNNKNIIKQKLFKILWLQQIYIYNIHKARLTFIV